MSLIDAQAILAEVRVNHAKLRSCARHDFVGFEDATHRAISAKNGEKVYHRFRCSNCGGTVDFNAWYWFEQGRKQP